MPSSSWPSSQLFCLADGCTNYTHIFPINREMLKLSFICLLFFIWNSWLVCCLSQYFWFHWTQFLPGLRLRPLPDSPSTCLFRFCGIQYRLKMKQRSSFLNKWHTSGFLMEISPILSVHIYATYISVCK